MVKTHIKSWFEVWHRSELNEPYFRPVKTKNIVVLQIEHSFNDDYIVELIKPDDYKQPLFSMKG